MTLLQTTTKNRLAGIRLAGLSLCCAIGVFASGITAVSADEAATDQDAVAKLEANLRKLMPPGSVFDGISESAMKGVYEVSVGGKSIYVHSNGDHVLIGEAYDVNRRVSLLDEKRAEKMAVITKNVDPNDMIVMKSDQESKAYVTVFTDIDCGYCRKLHQEIPELNKGGLEVRYMMFPRAGVNSDSYDKAVSAWCADDKADAITKAKNGIEIPALSCENPIASQYQMGLEAGVTGTPHNILEDGTIIPGYVQQQGCWKTLDSLTSAR